MFLGNFVKRLGQVMDVSAIQMMYYYYYYYFLRLLFFQLLKFGKLTAMITLSFQLQLQFKYELCYIYFTRTLNY